jgi:hypothetical protein
VQAIGGKQYLCGIRNIPDRMVQQPSHKCRLALAKTIIYFVLRNPRHGKLDQRRFA